MENVDNIENVETIERYSSYDQIPLYLDALEIMKILGLSRSKIYELMRGEDFPILILGGCRMVRKEKFFAWLESHEQKKTVSPRRKKATSSTF